ncbi:methyltransferase, TIGR04325 family [Agrobacterium larrymoorei]|uniref:methyltransferase, TIGR04325 family n=1 Tax=Agrobacterium larrymoorei TaxID=160699 RepID=UPI0030BCC777
MGYRFSFFNVLRNKTKSSDAKQFSSFSEALKAAGKGYSADHLSAYTWARQGPLFQDASPLEDVPWFGTAGLLAALPIAAKSDRPVRVLDFGGSTGTHYLLATQIYGHVPIGKWAVIETEPMVKRSLDYRSDHLRWFSDIDEAMIWLEACDLVFTSGALQYTPDPQAALSRLLNLHAPILAIQRCAVSLSTRSVTIVQKSRLGENARGPLPEGFPDQDIFYPVTYRPEADVMAQLRRHYGKVVSIRSDRIVKIAGQSIRSDTVICSQPSEIIT